MGWTPPENTVVQNPPSQQNPTVTGLLTGMGGVGQVIVGIIILPWFPPVTVPVGGVFFINGGDNIVTGVAGLSQKYLNRRSRTEVGSRADKEGELPILGGVRILKDAEAPPCGR